MNEQDLRDCFAMLSLVGLEMAYKDSLPESVLAERAYTIADAMLKARKAEPEPEIGIVAAKSRRKAKDA